MGYIRHHAIVITSFDNDCIETVRRKAVELFDKHFRTEGRCDFNAMVSPIVPSVMNGYCSFFIAPDGSKEGWEGSDIGDEFRNEFVGWMIENSDTPGCYCDWAEVQFYDEGGVTKIVRDSTLHIE